MACLTPLLFKSASGERESASQRKWDSSRQLGDTASLWNRERADSCSGQAESPNVFQRLVGLLIHEVQMWQTGCGNGEQA